MGKKTNEAFLDLYAGLDKLCSEKFGLPGGGVTEYITKLNNARFAPDRDDVLPKLVRLRTVRNSLVHDITRLKKSNEVQKADLKWIRTFTRSVEHRRDPISLYLRRARAFARRKRTRRVFAFILTLLILAGLAVGAYFLFR